MLGFPYGRGRDPKIIIDPDTNEEKIQLCNMNKPLSKKEIENEIYKGLITKEILLDLIQRGEKRVRFFLEPYIELAFRRKDIMTPFGKQFRNRQYLNKRFSYIVDTLNEKGYKHLSDKLSPLIESYNKSAAVPVKEAHTIPSIENIYENSSSFSDFEDKLQNLIETYENLLDITKKFNEEYKRKILKEVGLKKLKEEDAVNATIKMVTEADRESNRELKKILK